MDEMEIASALDAALEVGKLKGKLEAITLQVSTLQSDLKYKQDECDELRARAARSEGLLAQAQTTLNEMSAAVDHHWKEKQDASADT